MTTVQETPARPQGLATLAETLRRRKMLALVPFVFVLAATTSLAFFLPSLWRSQATIMVDRQQIPEAFVKSTVVSDVESRLLTLSQDILSRDRLLGIINRFNLYPELRGRMSADDLVEKMRKDIRIELNPEQTNDRRSRDEQPILFSVGYLAPWPGVATGVANTLAALYIEENTKLRERQAAGASDFLQAQLADVRKKLADQEAKITAYKEQHLGELPEQRDANLRALDRLQLEKTGNLEAIDRYVTMQMNLERQLSETPPMIFRETAGRTGMGGAAPVNPKVEAYKKKEQEYKELIVKATPNHPDVQRLKSELEQLKKEIPPEELAAAESQISGEAAPLSIPNPVYQNVTAQLRQIKTEMDIREKDKKRIESDIARYTKLIQDAPRVEQEISAVTRTNADLTKQHSDLKTKLEQARLAESLESRQKGAQFVVVDQANFPLEPFSPAPRIIILIGVVISLGVGLLTAIAVEYFNQRVWTHRELERLLEAPVLIEIPRMTTPTDVARARKRHLAQAVLAVVLIGVYMGGLYVLYQRQATVLRVLNPLIERYIIERTVN